MSMNRSFSKHKDTLKNHLIKLLERLEPADKDAQELCEALRRDDVIIPENADGKGQVYHFLLMVFSNKKRQKEQNIKRLLKFLREEGIEASSPDDIATPRHTER